MAFIIYNMISNITLNKKLNLTAGIFIKQDFIMVALLSKD